MWKFQLDCLAIIIPMALIICAQMGCKSEPICVQVKYNEVIRSVYMLSLLFTSRVTQQQASSPTTRFMRCLKTIGWSSHSGTHQVTYFYSYFSYPTIIERSAHILVWSVCSEYGYTHSRAIHGYTHSRVIHGYTHSRAIHGYTHFRVIHGYTHSHAIGKLTHVYTTVLPLLML